MVAVACKAGVPDRPDDKLLAKCNARHEGQRRAQTVGRTRGHQRHVRRAGCADLTDGEGHEGKDCNAQSGTHSEARSPIITSSRQPSAVRADWRSRPSVTKPSLA